MRRLLLLVSVLVFVDTMLYAALTPMLPVFADEFGLSKARAGALVAAYAAGSLIGGIPGGLAAARLGARRAVLVGLAGMGVAGVAFALADGFWSLFAARLLQGTGSAFTWAGAFAWLVAAAPRRRRGELLGAAMGAAVFGGLFGPVVGAAGAIAGRDVVFSALAGLSLVLAVLALRLADAPAPESPTRAAVGRAVRSRYFAGGLALMALPALLFGILSVLGPLHLDAAGWGAAAIGAVWLVAAGLETIQAPLIGRITDRRGRLLPVRVALAVAAAASALLATGARPLLYVPLIVVAATSFGSVMTPAFALIADGAERAGLAQGVGFGFMNAAWATGAVIGPAAGGAIANATGDWIPFLLAAALCAAALVAVRPRSRHERAAVLVDRLPGDAARVGRE